MRFLLNIVVMIATGLITQYVFHGNEAESFIAAIVAYYACLILDKIADVGIE